jgi:energy-coupling factor transporter ATP-binding protein EcfA2
MTIKEFSYEDKSSGWRLDKLQLVKINLLVGASGAGKTQILKALMSLNNLATGENLFGNFVWKIILESKNNTIYCWEGEFDFNKNSQIVFERIFLEKEQIVKRENKETIFKNQAPLRLNQHKSVLHILQEEEVIYPIQQFFCHFILNDFASNTALIKLSPPIENNRKELKLNIDDIRQRNDLSILEKVYLLFKFDSDNFNQILNGFISVFPQIENATFKEMQGEYNHFLFKDKNSAAWLDPLQVSSGMLRVFLQLSEIYLCPDGTVFLIDEFENSLGINCIDELTKVILNSNRNLQFVITSHHPYIINNIPFEYWKIVTRKGNTITTHDASEFNLGRSKHDRFMQLLQLEEYQTGVSV